jgi:hypothetical protein
VERDLHRVIVIAIILATVAGPTLFVVGSPYLTQPIGPSLGNTSSGLRTAECAFPTVQSLGLEAYAGPADTDVTLNTHAGDNLLVITVANYTGVTSSFGIGDGYDSAFTLVENQNSLISGMNYALQVWNATVPSTGVDDITISWSAPIATVAVLAYDLAGANSFGFGGIATGNEPTAQVVAPLCSLGLGGILLAGSYSPGINNPYGWNQIDATAITGDYFQALTTTTITPNILSAVFTGYTSDDVLASVGYAAGEIPNARAPYGAWTTVCGSPLDHNVSECNPGAPGNDNAFSPNSATVNNTTAPGFIQLNADIHVGHSTLAVFFGGIWYNWTVGSGIRSALGTYTAGNNQIVTTGLSYVPTGTLNQGILVITVGWYNTSCPGCFDDQIVNESSWLTIIEGSVNFNFPSAAPSLSVLQTIPGIEIIGTGARGPTFKPSPIMESCGVDSGIGYDNALGGAIMSFDQVSLSNPTCAYTSWWNVTSGATVVNVTSNIGSAGSIGGSGAPPRPIIYDPPDNALLTTDLNTLYILNVTGGWTDTHQAFPSELQYEPIGSTDFGSLFYGAARDIFVFSYAYTGGHLVRLTIVGPPIPYGDVEQGGSYGNDGIVTNTLAGNNGTYLLSLGFVPPAPSITSALPPANRTKTQLIVTIDLPSEGTPFSNATLYYGLSCSHLTGLSAVAEGYSSNLTTSGIVWLVRGLFANTTYCFSATVWNIFGESNQSATVNGSTIGIPAPTINVLVGSPMIVEISLPYSFCGVNCNIYDLENATVYYAPNGTSEWIAASWNLTFHEPNGVGINWQGVTSVYLSALEPGVLYTFAATVWDDTNQSLRSPDVNATVPTMNSTLPPPVIPRVGANATNPQKNISYPTNPLGTTVVLYLGQYAPAANGLFTATANWTNRFNSTFVYEFALEASYLTSASSVNVTANGVRLTPVNQFGVGSTVVYVFPGSVAVKPNGSVLFTVAFVYTQASPLAGGVVINNAALSSSDLYALVSVIIVACIAFVSLAMKKTSPYAILASTVFLMVLGVQLFA